MMVGRLRGYWKGIGNGIVAAWGLAIWLFCLAAEVMALRDGVRLNIAVVSALAIGTVIHLWLTIRYMQNPLPFLRRTLPLMLTQVFWFIMAFVIVVQ